MRPRSSPAPPPPHPPQVPIIDNTAHECDLADALEVSPPLPLPFPLPPLIPPPSGRGARLPPHLRCHRQKSRRLRVGQVVAAGKAARGGVSLLVRPLPSDARACAAAPPIVTD